MMPHMTGIELLEVVRQEPRWLSIPFIFLTARGEKTDIQQGKRLGVEDYIVKPYDPVDLMIIIRSRIKRSEEIESVHTSAVEQIKRNILTILNHEFRTPLTFVVAYADMLNMPTPDQMNDQEMLGYLKGISSGAERLRNLIENFILLVELETGEALETYRWRRRPITDVRALLDTAWGSIASREEVYHVCKIDVAENIPAFTGDEEYLRRALQHLLSNAVKFSPAQQPIMMRAFAQDGYVVIDVQDRGRGIPPEEINHIWSSFYQINRAFYEDQGAGSGLAIVKRVAELHGGYATVESTFGEGSIFSLYLPIQ
jgi:signal transduction histidine kinase